MIWWNRIEKKYNLVHNTKLTIILFSGGIHGTGDIVWLRWSFGGFGGWIVKNRIVCTETYFDIPAVPEDFAPYIGTGEDSYIGEVVRKYHRVYIRRWKVKSMTNMIIWRNNMCLQWKERKSWSGNCAGKGWKSRSQAARPDKSQDQSKILGLDPSEFDVVITGCDVTKKKPRSGYLPYCGEPLRCPARELHCRWGCDKRCSFGEMRRDDGHRYPIVCTGRNPEILRRGLYCRFHDGSGRGDPWDPINHSFPGLYVKSLAHVDFEELRRQGIRVVLLDIDNTLSKHGSAVGGTYAVDQVARIRELGLECVIISNAIYKRAKTFAIPWTFLSAKRTETVPKRNPACHETKAGLENPKSS